MKPVDKRALKALLSTYWDSGGWKAEGERSIDPAEFAHAKSAGVMFDTPLVMDHECLVEKLRDIIQHTNLRRVSDAFIASLSSRRLDLRSALGSYAVFQHLPTHEAVVGSLRCATCGTYLKDSAHDLNILSFERWKWGGVRHDHSIYAFFDLKIFSEQEAPNLTTEDVRILRELLDVIRSVDNTMTSGRLEATFAKFLKSNKAERDILISILGFCGILRTPGHPPYSNRFIPVSQRELPDRRFVDMSYPACWWTGSDGIDENEVIRHFGHVL